VCLYRKNSYKNFSWTTSPEKILKFLWKLWDCIKASLLKWWPPGAGWGHNMRNCFYMCLYRKNIFKIARTTGPETIKFIWKLSDIVQKQIWDGHRRLGPQQLEETFYTVMFTYGKYLFKKSSLEPQGHSTWAGLLKSGPSWVGLQ
jgi:hypothetical protein